MAIRGEIMKSKIRRIALLVPPEIDDVLIRLSRQIGAPKTMIIMELIKEAMPVFRQVLETVEKVQGYKQEAAYSAIATVLEGSKTGLADLAGKIAQAELELEELKGKPNAE